MTVRYYESLIKEKKIYKNSKQAAVRNYTLNKVKEKMKLDLLLKWSVQYRDLIKELCQYNKSIDHLKRNKNGDICKRDLPKFHQIMEERQVKRDLKGRVNMKIWRLRNIENQCNYYDSLTDDFIGTGSFVAKNFHEIYMKIISGSIEVKTI